MKTVLLVILAFLGAPLPAGAVEPGEMLADPVLEARARDISRNLRCLVCQNQSIDDSNADLARDLRVLVRERLVAGDSDTAVIDYMVARYGDFVLLKPPFKAATYVLWVGPGLIGGAGLVAVLIFFRRRASATLAQPAHLTEAERRRLEALMEDDRR